MLKLVAFPHRCHQSRCTLSMPHTAGNVEQLVVADFDL